MKSQSIGTQHDSCHKKLRSHSLTVQVFKFATSDYAYGVT